MRGRVIDSRVVLIVFVLPNHHDFLFGAWRGCVARGGYVCYIASDFLLVPSTRYLTWGTAALHTADFTGGQHTIEIFVGPFFDQNKGVRWESPSCLIKHNTKFPIIYCVLKIFSCPISIVLWLKKVNK